MMGWFGPLFMIIFWVLIIVLIVLLIRSLLSSNCSSAGPNQEDWPRENLGYHLLLKVHRLTFHLLVCLDLYLGGEQKLIGC